MNSNLTLRCGCFPLFFVAATVSFFVGMITLFALSDVAEAAVVIGMIMGPPALFLFSIGASLTLVKVQVFQSEDPIRIVFRLPRAGSAPLLPSMVHLREITVQDITRVDVMLRPNAAAVGGFERLYHLRTVGGDFYFNSRWFVKWQDFEDFVRQQGIHMLIGNADEVMDRIAQLPASDADTAPRDSVTRDSAPLGTDETAAELPDSTSSRSLGQFALRGCGWVGFVILVLIMLLGALVAFFGEPGDRKGGWMAMAVAAVGLGSVKMLTSYRRVS